MNLIERPHVPNVQPKLQAPYRIAIIGEAPGEHEANEGKPFVGPSGRFLNVLLQDAGIQRDACLVGNVCQYRPPGNKLSSFNWNGDEIQEGLAELRHDLQVFQPNLCLLLGAVPLHAAKTSAPFRASKPMFPISNYRGTLFVSTDNESPFYGLKCMATFHPAYLLRMYDYHIVSRFDLRKARKEGTSTELALPQRNLRLDASLEHIFAELDRISQDKLKIALDIEGGCNTMSCISIATSPHDVFIIPFTKADGTSYWGEGAEVALWRKLAKVLADPHIPKILQNCLYDAFVLGHSYHTPIRGIVDDTMLKHWEYLCSLEKNLGFQTSIYTDEPYYKSDRKTDTQKTFWAYCCKDSAVTYEISDKLDKLLMGKAKDHYNYNMSMLYPMLYMQLRGIRFDEDKRQQRISELSIDRDVMQDQLDEMAGGSLNVKSPKQMQKFLYETLGLPPQRKRGSQAITTDFEAILKLAHKTNDERLYHIIKLRKLRDRISHLQFGLDKDGRVRCSYNVVGTETGRLSCYQSASGSGTNLQTITEKDRDLFIADEGYHFFQCDLAGADGWTVAAHCARLGDSTMLEDLLFGLKIPKILALMVQHGADTISRLSRQELKIRTDEVQKSDGMYFACKCCQHGSNYGMSSSTLSQLIFNKSFGDVVLGSHEAKRIQTLYYSRYKGILRWHDYIREQCRKGFLDSASGHRRPVLGRQNDPATLKAMLSHEPQNNTTYATNRAALALWTDPANNPLIVEPLHQVHDALCGQFPIARTDWAVKKLREWFDFELNICGIPIHIPFEGKYGPSWGEQVGTI